MSSKLTKWTGYRYGVGGEWTGGRLGSLARIKSNSYLFDLSRCSIHLTCKISLPTLLQPWVAAVAVQLPT